jgi:hypothetical protein
MKLQEAGKNCMRNFIYLYSSPNIIRKIKSKRKRWAGNVAGMGR